MSIFDRDHSARLIAYDEHEHNFSSRRGSGEWSEDEKTIGFYVYDNNPWSHDQELRDRHYAKLVVYMAQRGCRLAAHDSYPRDGENAGYTLAMIFISATPDQVNADQQAACEFISNLVAHVYEGHAPGERTLS
jgi:hypothetical protein